VFQICPGSKNIGSLDKVRLASEADFKDFRCSFEGFENRNVYEFSDGIKEC
jgi:hypothetical protein